MENLLLKSYNLEEKIFNKVDKSNDQIECNQIKDSWKIAPEDDRLYLMKKIQNCIEYEDNFKTFSNDKFLKKILKESDILALKKLAIEAERGSFFNQMAAFFTKASYIPSKKYFTKKIFDDLSITKPQNESIGQTPLHCAAEFGHLTICILIIEKLAEKNPKTKLGCTPLHTAAFHGHLEVCQYLMKFQTKEKNPKDLDVGRTPLHWAAKKGKIHNM